MKIEISTAELLELQGWRITLCDTEETEPEQTGSVAVLR